VKQEIQTEKQPVKHLNDWKAFGDRSLKMVPAVQVQKQGANYGIKPTPGEDEGLKYLQLFKLSGMVEMPGAQLLLDQLIKVSKEGWVNSSLSLATELQPQDAVEGMLAAQMVAAHNLAMKTASTAITGKDLNLRQAEYASKTALQAMRVFAAQVETLAKYRSKGNQKITVQYQHIDNRGGQAVIGDVNQGGG
jgi:hypothetical protein